MTTLARCHLINDLFKDFRLVLGDIGQDFSVNDYILLLKGVYKDAVAHVLFADSGIYLYLPKATTGALFFFTASVGVSPGVQKCLPGGTFF